jgi:hypothetical protein
LSGVRNSWLILARKLRLVLACAFELSALVLDFIEQPHVFDGNCRLVRKRRNQFDLLVSEGADFVMPDGQDDSRCCERLGRARTHRRLLLPLRLKPMLLPPRRYSQSVTV